MNLAHVSISDSKSGYSTTEVARLQKTLPDNLRLPHKLYSPWEQLVSSYYVQSMRQDAQGVKRNSETILALLVVYYVEEKVDP